MCAPSWDPQQPSVAFYLLPYSLSSPQTHLKISPSAARKKSRGSVSKCHGDAWDDVWFAVCEEILFWVSCDSLPYCPVKQEGQATEKEHMSAFPSAAAPTCVTSSSLSPPARPKPYSLHECQPTKCVSLNRSGSSKPEFAEVIWTDALKSDPFLMLPNQKIHWLV